MATLFTGLSWADLEQWAGQAILTRGKAYQSRVTDLAMTEEGALIADVAGGMPYITCVWFEGSALDHDCSCPYWGPCKHAIAVVLAYLRNVKSNISVTVISAAELDARLSLSIPAADPDEPFALWPGVELESELTAAANALASMTPDQLLEWAERAVTENPFLASSLPQANWPADEKPEKTVARLRRQIRKTTAEHGWQNYWDRSGYTPDYAPIKQQLTNLLLAGQIDAVLDLGDELFSRGTTQVEESDDEGETAGQIIACLVVVMEAMALSERSAVQKLIWFWDKSLQDDVGLLSELDPPLGNTAMAPADWRTVANEFNDRLENHPKPKSSAQFSTEPDDFYRQQLLSYTLQALTAAGEHQQALELMIAELPFSDGYIGLVDHLVAQAAYDQAEHWARVGFNSTKNRLLGVAQRLVEQLIDLAQRRKQWQQAAALQIDVFIQQPSLSNYQLAKKGAEKADCWPLIGPALLGFLETGALPQSTVDWPLPNTALQFPSSGYPPPFPDYNQLTEIALHEKEIEQAIHWFQQSPATNYHAAAVAEAAQGSHPEVSLSIWQHLAESLIAKVKPKAYQEAMPWLKKAKQLMQGLDRSEEYQGYLAELRTTHKAKRRLMAELDTLDGISTKKRRIVDD